MKNIDFKEMEKFAKVGEPLTIKDIKAVAHEIAVEKGWYGTGDAGDYVDPRSFGDHMALWHSEISEALEAFRSIEHNKPWAVVRFYKDEQHVYKPEGVPIEIADLLIRVFDFCEYYEIDIENAIRHKVIYNKTRAERHGGKRI